MVKECNVGKSEEEITEIIFSELHKFLVAGFDSVKGVVKGFIKKHWSEDDGDLT